MKKIISFLLIFVTILSFSAVSVKVAYAENDMSLNSKSAYLMDFASGEVLYEKDSKEHLQIASMVKMMTILLSLEEYEMGNVDLDTKITTTENASGMGGSQVFIDPYVEYRFEDLLKSVIVASANDASVALAEYFNGTEKNFVARMNKRAKELGMSDTYYTNCTGLPAPEQYSCAKDSAIVMKEILKHDLYHKYSTIWMDELVHPSGRKTELTNTNRLIRYYNGCDGGKTGSTNEAGCCLTASALRDDMRLISVIVGAENSKTRFNESAALLNFGFSNFENKMLVDRDLPVAKLEVLKGKVKEFDVFAEESFSCVVKKGDQTDFEVLTKLDDKTVAPCRMGEKLGSLIITKNGNVVKEINLVAKEDIERLSYFETLQEITGNW